MSESNIVTTEPTRLIGAINTAAAATVGLLTLLGVFSPEVGGAATLVLSAWIAVATELLRASVTPVAAPSLSREQVSNLTVQD